MRLTRMTGLALMAGLGLSACATQSAAGGAPTADAQPADDPAATELREHHRHNHRGGVTQFVAMSLDTLGVDDAKRPQVDKLQDDLHVCMVPTGEIRKRLLLTLADGIAAGTIGTEAVDASLAQLSTAAASVHDCSADVLNRLHAVLSPEERAALVDKVQAHWEVWQQVNQEDDTKDRAQGGRVAELARDVGLTQEQADRISTSLRAMHAGMAGKFDSKKAEAHVAAFATGFAGETFDAKTVAVNANGELASHGGRQMALFYETVAPLLTPEQRTMLAAHLREHASHQPAISAK